MNIEALTKKLEGGAILPPDKFVPLTKQFLNKIRWGYAGDTVDSCRLTTSTGIVLNDFLPKGITICDVPHSERCDCAFGVVYLDLDYYLSLGEIGAISICHELGHTVNPDTIQMVFSPSIIAEVGTDEYYIEAFLKNLALQNQVLKNEVEAWEYGHVFADLMGIREELYHSQMTKSLTAYYVHMSLNLIEKIKEVEKKQLFSATDVFEYYDVWLQSAVQLTFPELRERMTAQEKELITRRDNLRPLHDRN